MVAIGFVGILYMAPSNLRNLDRDHPKQIIFRSIATLLYCILAFLPSIAIYSIWGPFHVPIEALHGLVDVVRLVDATARSLLLVLALFSGPVLVSGMHGCLKAIE